MNMLIRMVIAVLLFTLLSCSGRATGPITGTRYKIDVGCTEDMQRYKEEREQVTGEKSGKIQAKDIKLDCPPGEQ